MQENKQPKEMLRAMIGEFCDWCNEYRRNRGCKECEECLKCPYFERDCCRNEMVVAEYRKEWSRPSHVVGIGPPLCRKYCPHVTPEERQRASVYHSYTPQ